MAAVPAGSIAERRVVIRLMPAGAVSMETAQPLEGLRWMQARRLKRLLDTGVVREASSGRYYLDAPALADHMTARVQRALIMLSIVVMLMGLAIYFWRP